MLSELEIAAWWDAMTAQQRIEKVKELQVWNPSDRWQVAWGDLSAANRQKLSTVLAGLLPTKK